MISKEQIQKRLVELQMSLQNAQIQLVKMQSNIDAHRGAIQQCEEFLKELKLQESQDPKEIEIKK